VVPAWSDGRSNGVAYAALGGSEGYVPEQTPLGIPSQLATAAAPPSLWLADASDNIGQPLRDEVSLEEDMKTFLGEMVVVGEHFSNTFASHRLHGDAIGQAVFLVRSGFVKGQGIEK
jgi:hypothetical protein